MEARRALALAALPGLRSEDLFVERTPGAREWAGRPSPTLADLVGSAASRTLAALPRNGPTLVALPPPCGTPRVLEVDGEYFLGPESWCPPTLA